MYDWIEPGMVTTNFLGIVGEHTLTVDWTLVLLLCLEIFRCMRDRCYGADYHSIRRVLPQASIVGWTGAWGYILASAAGHMMGWGRLSCMYLCVCVCVCVHCRESGRMEITPRATWLELILSISVRS